ncbi:L-rhamnose mutarotase, partial [Streptomyces sp. NPDC006386]|uniref:L-rhamnose mutarotase n=1 Tax=Streptomyces sp. NPDC006386 TaxID=3156762 RepID=UPI00339ED77D
MRVALHTKVRADRVAAYEAAHREVPEELTDAIRAAGATAWTIWRSGTDLFHVLECEDYTIPLASIDCRPPRSETIMNGTPHQVLTMIAENRCQKVSSS